MKRIMHLKKKRSKRRRKNKVCLKHRMKNPLLKKGR